MNHRIKKSATLTITLTILLTVIFSVFLVNILSCEVKNIEAEGTNSVRETSPPPLKPMQPGETAPRPTSPPPLKQGQSANQGKKQSSPPPFNKGNNAKQQSSTAPTSPPPNNGQSTAQVTVPAKGLNNLVLNKVNKFRTDSGLKALKVGSDMSSYTNIRANELRTKFSHTRPNGQICYDFFINKHPIKSGGTIGENIAMHCSTQRESNEAIAEIIVEGWKNSPGHRKIMLLPNVDYISIGVAKDTKEFVPGYSGNCSYFVLWVGRY